MLLALNNITEYLLNSKGLDSNFLLENSDVVELPFEIIEIERAEEASRNYGFFINRIPDKNVKKRYFVKQLRTFNTADVEGFFTEYLCLKTFAEDNIYQEMKDKVAPIIHYDKYNHIITTKLLSYAYNPYKPHYDSDLIIQMAKVLKTLHSVKIHDEFESKFKHQKPFLLDIDVNQINFTLNVYGANKKPPKYYEILSDNFLLNRLEEISKKWEYICLTHGDIKIHNFLKFEGNLHLVDWEYADWGDPMWDLAGILKELLYQNIDSSFNRDVRINIVKNKEEKLGKLLVETYFDYEYDKDYYHILLIEYTAVHLLRAYFNSFGHKNGPNKKYYEKAIEFISYPKQCIKELF